VPPNSVASQTVFLASSLALRLLAFTEDAVWCMPAVESNRNDQADEATVELIQTFFAALFVVSTGCAQYQYPRGTPQTFEKYNDYPQRLSNRIREVRLDAGYFASRGIRHGLGSKKTVAGEGDRCTILSLIPIQGDIRVPESTAEIPLFRRYHGCE
jgi:hypothetical protein